MGRERKRKRERERERERGGERERERETRSRHWHIYTVSSTVIHIHPTRGTISKILSLPFYYIKILAVWSARRTVYRPP